MYLLIQKYKQTKTANDSISNRIITENVLQIRVFLDEIPPKNSDDF